MDDPNITMKEYIRLEEEKARRCAIVFNVTLTSEVALSCEPTVSSLNNDEIDFRISFGKSDDEDCTDKDNDDDKIDIEHSFGDLSVKPLPDVINTDVGAYAHGVLYKVEDIATYLVEYVKFWDDWEVDRYGNANLGDLDNSTNNVLIPLDSWTSGLVVYRLPLSGGAIVFTQWIEKMEFVQDMSGCSIDQKVKYTAASFVGKALTCHEMQNLETMLWNHVMVGAGHVAYTDRFHELARLVPHLVTPESRKIERYVYGLALQIRGMVTATEPKTIQKVVQISGALTDEAVRN
ncbi:hypothetical protein Tco_0431971 [Tanacetum coccineum]